eukprot:CAMPEP_0168337220 /NCGR_PEP_ID=MMETSP0213-20121227/12034_1 /TAXON_ID=151035 /ORGANISM="Euplotes harpa, Strain FSP1.4" /LENGTH=195 /DNA_ID=CAMNT_0008342615 /DNA_START=295 /DNA_END=882 /DNA_ORIENTATION=+
MKALKNIAAIAAIVIVCVFRYAAAGCRPGTYGSEGDCKICPYNYYCPGDTAQPLQCPPGFTSFDGEAKCVEMNEDELEYRLTRRLFTCSSQPGYICSGSSSVECADGNYCPGANNQYACPLNSYCPKASGTEAIPSGYYSDSGDDDYHICPRGYYCNGGSKVACSSGSYAFEGSTLCTTCPSGSKCPSTTQGPEV